MKTTFTIKHKNYMFTIAESIQAIEEISEGKVKQISKYDDEVMTFEIEFIEPETEIPNLCNDCGVRLVECHNCECCGACCDCDLEML